jgi:hypothetical protein
MHRLTKQQVKDIIAVWKNRAEMARQQGNNELTEVALKKAREYEDALARRQEFELEDT